jgi:uncharacterized membrane protein YgdD (TMEM256/DUF423 family)
MNSKFIKIGSILGALSIVLGAFGAHLFKDFLAGSGRLETYETAVKYQFYGSFSLILVGILCSKFNAKNLIYSGNLFWVGTFIFSGSLYLLCFTGVKIFGAITPIGGVLLIAAWVFLFLAVHKNQVD